MTDLLSADMLGRVGTAAQLAALAFDTGPRPASLGSTYLVSSDRVLRGWTLQLFLVALLIPPVFALIDAAARARARGARPSITVRRVLWRAAGMALGVLVIRLRGCAGVISRRALAALRRQRRRRLAVAGRVPPGPRRRRAVRWPRAACPWTPTPPAPGATSARTLALLVGAALAFAGNPYLLVLVIPALHVWLLLPAHGAPGRRGALGRGAGGLARARGRDRAARRRRAASASTRPPGSCA